MKRLPGESEKERVKMKKNWFRLFEKYRKQMMRKTQTIEQSNTVGMSTKAYPTVICKISQLERKMTHPFSLNTTTALLLIAFSGGITMAHAAQKDNMADYYSSPDYQRERIKCLRHLNLKVYQESALDLMYTYSRQEDDKSKISYIKRLSQYLQDNPDYRPKKFENKAAFQQELGNLYTFLVARYTLQPGEEFDPDKEIIKASINKAYIHINEALPGTVKDLPSDFTKIFSNNSFLKLQKFPYQAFVWRYQKLTMHNRLDQSSVTELERLKEDITAYAFRPNSSDDFHKRSLLEKMVTKISRKLAEYFPPQADKEKILNRKMSYYLDAEKRGDKISAYRLGVIYEENKLIDPSYSQRAFECYSKASSLDYPLADHRLATALLNGDPLLGLDINEEEGLRLLISSSKHGHPESQYVLAQYFQEGTRLVEQDHNLAFKLMLMSAKAGYSHAQRSLGLYYRDGIGTESSTEKFFHWTRQAASQFETSAYWDLARCYEKGTGTERNLEEAYTYYGLVHKNIDSMSLRARLKLGRLNEKKFAVVKTLVSEELKTVFKDYQVASGAVDEETSQKAYYHLGRTLLYGIGTEPDPVQAYENLLKADLHNRKVSFLLGFMHHFGIGTSYDVKKANKYYKEAAQANYFPAIVFRAYNLNKGIGVTPNSAKALELWENGSKIEGAPAEGLKECAYRAGKILTAQYYESYLDQINDQQPNSLDSDQTNQTNNQQLFKQAEKYLKAADESSEVLYQLGILHHTQNKDGKFTPTALDYFEKAAAKGHPMALYHMAYNVKRQTNDLNEVLQYYIKADEKGCREAKQAIAETYATIGTEECNEKAAEFLEMVDHTPSRINLKMRKKLANKGSKEALKQLHDYAKNDDLFALRYLAEIYESGKVVTPDLAQSIAYYKRAAALGNLGAQRRLEILKTFNLLDILHHSINLPGTN